MDIEKQLIQIIATDRIDKPISSMSGKLKRAKPKLAEAVPLNVGDSYEGERVFARVEDEDILKARGMKEGISKFEEEFPRYGKILRGYIEEKRSLSETHLYFGMYEGKRLTSDDYLGVMTNLGFSDKISRDLYPELMEVSYKLARKRNETERSIMIG